nr:hypothetical protein [Tanacetum cinerariifolium]
DPSNVALRKEEMVYATAFKDTALDEEKDAIYEAEDADSLFSKRLDVDVALDMIKPVDDTEIKEALFSIDYNKAFGPDEYSSKFFKAAWSVVGPDLCTATKEFFVKGKLLGEFN